jgi:hypothetical protein
MDSIRRASSARRLRRAPPGVSSRSGSPSRAHISGRLKLLQNKPWTRCLTLYKSPGWRYPQVTCVWEWWTPLVSTQYWAHVSGRQTPGLTRGLPSHLLYKRRGEPRGLASWDLGSVNGPAELVRVLNLSWDVGSKRRLEGYRIPDMEYQRQYLIVQTMCIHSCQSWYSLHGRGVDEQCRHHFLLAGPQRHPRCNAHP